LIKIKGTSKAQTGLSALQNNNFNWMTILFTLTLFIVTFRLRSVEHKKLLVMQLP